jgi:hypothetical protein
MQVRLLGYSGSLLIFIKKFEKYSKCSRKRLGKNSGKNFGKKFWVKKFWSKNFRSKNIREKFVVKKYFGEKLVKKFSGTKKLGTWVIGPKIWVQS